MVNKSESGKKFRLKWVLVIGLIFVTGIVFAGMFNTALSTTNTTEFCTSCHSMQYILEEYKDTIHYKNASGTRPGCADCHVPKAFFPKMKAKILAYKDVLGEIMGTIDTKEKLEQHRWEMASHVWARMKANDSAECRSCHQYEYMDLSEQDRSARNRHSRAQDEGKTCIDCHKGVAHEEPDEPEEPEEAG